MKNDQGVVSKPPFFKPLLIIFSTLSLLLSTCLAYAENGHLVGFDKAMLLGHSFFRPGAEDLEILAPRTGYVRHNQHRHSAGGYNGDPGSIWRDVGEDEGPKLMIKEGGVELLGLTSYSELDGDSEYEDYVQWIDFTLTYNADSLDTVVIFAPWDSYTLYPNYDDYRARIDVVNDIHNTLVRDLRATYPDLTILHIPGAEMMVRLWKLFDDGLLGPEVGGVWKFGDRTHLQYDNKGHAGYVLEDALGMIWHQTIYPATDVRTIENPYTFTDDWTYDLRQLAYEVWSDEFYAHRYNDEPIGPEAPEFYSNPIIESDANADEAYGYTTLAKYAGDANRDALMFAKVSGPSWLNVAANGDLSGTPSITDLDLNSFVVSVTDGNSAPVEATLEIFVNNFNPNNNAPVFTSSSLTRADASVDQNYNGTIAGSATDADGDTLTYSKVSGADWLTVASDGTLSGTPNAAYIGDSVATISVSDGDGGTATATLTITVIEAFADGVLIDDDMESLGNTDWVTDWGLYTDVTGNTSMRANGATNDLESPEMNTSSLYSLTLSFNYYNSEIDADDDVTLLLWNGTSYIAVEEIGENGNGAWLQYTRTITQAQYPMFFQSGFKFKIEASNVDAGEAVLIDDVLLTTE